MMATGDVKADSVWLLWNNGELVGYSLANISASVLRVDNLLLMDGVGAAAAVSALAKGLDVEYIGVRVDHPSVAASLCQAGYSPDQPGWSTFMVKSLDRGVTTDDARQLFGVGMDGHYVTDYNNQIGENAFWHNSTIFALLHFPLHGMLDKGIILAG